MTQEAFLVLGKRLLSSFKDVMAIQGDYCFHFGFQEVEICLL